jgi:uncharacterized protein YkwD
MQLFLSVLACALSLVLTWQPAAAISSGLQLTGDPAIAQLLSVEQALLDLTNADRALNGVPPLQFDPEMVTIARQRATSQLGTPSLSHYDAKGDLVFVSLLADAQLGYQRAGENLARSSANDPGLTEHVEEALMRSPQHRENILEPNFKRLSIGVATDASGQITFAEIYRD